MYVLWFNFILGLNFNVAKYHLGKVKLELMQPASMPNQLISVRQVKYELMQSAVSPLWEYVTCGTAFRGFWFIAQLS